MMRKNGVPNGGRVKRILISQPKPESPKNPYFDLAKRYKVDIEFRPFITVEGIPAREFRRTRINPYHFNSVIFTSRNSVDHFFRICEEMRIRMPQETKFFCVSESIALYLQKYTQYRKRRVFFANGEMDDLREILKKHKEGGSFLLPCSDAHQDSLPQFLEENKFEHTIAIMYLTIPSDLSDIKDLTTSYDMVVFFSPAGIKSLFKNFPKFKQRNLRIGTFGSTTSQAAEKAGLKIAVQAPVPGAKSMTAAISNYLHEVNK
jgi:uroporphyrinogen-III synthase